MKNENRYEKESYFASHMRIKSLFGSMTLLIALVVVGCSPPPASEPQSDSNSDDVVILGESSDPNTGLNSISELQIVIPANDFQIGQPRIPFIIMDGGTMTGEVEQVFLTVFDLSQESPAVVWEGSGINYSDYTVPYWIFYPQIDTAGTYGVRAKMLRQNGESTEAQFAIEVLEKAIAPAVGDAGFPSQSRTATDAETLKTISSDFEPDPELYTLSVADALSNGRPTVISFSTPAYCQTAICAPVLESVKQVKAQNNNAVNFLHVDIFADFETFAVDQTITEWNLQSEPWTYVLDSSGIITARLAGPVSPSELASHLESTQ
ncbi:MAG: hypothetical protein ACI9EW_000024 [Cellvibrionaceae bacterium]|jgi:hypothetical protein